jgi:hypothetical protein
MKIILMKRRQYEKAYYLSPEVWRCSSIGRRALQNRGGVWLLVITC